MTNERERQTYYGAINLLTNTVHLQERPVGDGASTVAYLRWCQILYPNKKLLLLWDGASYHRGQEMQTFLVQEKAGVAYADGKMTCTLRAPKASKQNAVDE